MKLTINGVEFDNPERLDIVFDVAPEGETLNGINIMLRGGRLLVVGDKPNAVAVNIKSDDTGGMDINPPPPDIKRHEYTLSVQQNPIDGAAGLSIWRMRKGKE